eukprot:10170152-Alexandrium_andersonii.AAC.1
MVGGRVTDRDTPPYGRRGTAAQSLARRPAARTCCCGALGVAEGWAWSAVRLPAPPGHFSVAPRA